MDFPLPGPSQVAGAAVNGIASSSPLVAADTFADCDELLNWLMQNPENITIDPFDHSAGPLVNPFGNFASIPTAVHSHSSNLGASISHLQPSNQPLADVDIPISHFFDPQTPLMAPLSGPVPGQPHHNVNLLVLPQHTDKMFFYSEMAPHTNSGVGNGLAPLMSTSLHAHAPSFPVTAPGSISEPPDDGFDDSGSSDGEDYSAPPLLISGSTGGIPAAKRKRDNSHSSLSNLATAVGSKTGRRKTSKESIDEMERRAKELEEENAALQSHLMNVTQRTTDMQRKKAAMERAMAEKVQGLQSQGDAEATAITAAELGELVRQYTELYADYGKCRQNEVEFHLNQLEKLLTPTQATKMFLWSLHQDSSFFDSDKSPLFGILNRELDLRPDQLEKIQQRRPKVHELLRQLQESLDLIKALRSAINLRHDALDSRCTAVQNNATVKQIVYFLLWISRNSHTLAQCIPNFNKVPTIVPPQTTTTTMTMAGRQPIRAEGIQQQAYGLSSGTSSSLYADAGTI